MADDDDPTDRYAAWFERHSGIVVIALLLATAFVGAGIVVADADLEISQFEVDSAEQRADDEIRSNFGTDDRSYTQVVVRADDPSADTVSKESLLETLEFQRELRQNETVNATLAAEQPTIGVGNAVAIATDPRLRFFGAAPIESKTAVLEGRTQDQIYLVLGNTLEDQSFTPEGQPPLSSLVPSGYHPDTDDRAEARLVIVVHDGDASEDELLEAQRTIEALADEEVTTADTAVLAQALSFERGAAATGESFALIGPLMVIVVLGVLSVAYRDPVDVALAGLGIGLTLVWTGGLVGWLGLEFSQLLVAVPCLLVGLSIDYALHVEMRYREQRRLDPTRSVRRAMGIGLAGVLVAIGATTLTTAAGFLSSYASPIELLREFGLVAALGIGSAFVVFGALLPALKVEIATRTGRDGTGRPIGALETVARPLARVVRVVDRAPVAVVAVALLLAVGGALGATAVDTSSERTDFLPEEPGAWTTVLPDRLQPTDNGVRETAVFVEETFDPPTEPTVEILVSGNVTDPSTLGTVDEAEREAIGTNVTVAPADGTPTVYTPLDAIESAAEEDDDVAALVDEADTTGDGVPDRNLTAVYDAVFEVDPDAAAETIHRTDDGEYDALRLSITVDDDADGAVVTEAFRGVAGTIDTVDGLEAIATGGPILEYLQERAVLETVLGTFLLALGVIAAVLTALFRRRHGSWTLGAVTIAPVVFAIAWLIGTMAVLSIPFNAETALITAIAIGLGTDYTIHVTERFLQERRDRDRLAALETTVLETGGVVLASATTTAAGFAVLLLTVVPSLQRFGFVTALVVVYAVLASVVVLPGLLVLWDRYRNGSIPTPGE